MSADDTPSRDRRALLDAVRLRLAEEGHEPTPARVAAALRSQGRLLGDTAVLGVVRALRSEMVGAGPLEPLLAAPDVTDVLVNGPDEVWVDRGSGLERARHALQDNVRSARETFAGPITYASGPWETVDWELFDLVSVDAYRDADNAARYRDELRAYRRFGKPVAVTEFGCSTYRGAADRGGMGWMIVDVKSDPPVIPGTFERDEEEQVRYLNDMLAVYEAEGIDSAFWHTFAGFEAPRHHTDPHRDLDLASYGVVAVLEQERGTTYPDMAWEPKQVFGALAAAYAHARP